MSRHPRKDIQRRAFTDLQGRSNLLLRPPAEWLDPVQTMPADLADLCLAWLRRLGVELWLAQDNGAIRTRMAWPFEPPHELLVYLTRHARALGMAVDRSGQSGPPLDNAYGDQPLPPGGHWDWL